MAKEGVSESERVWKSIDRLEKTVFNQNTSITTLNTQLKTTCKAITDLKTTITNHQVHKDRITIAIISIIGVIITGVNLVITHVI